MLFVIGNSFDLSIFQEILLHGSGEINIEYYMRRKLVSKPFPGVFKLLQKRLEDTIRTTTPNNWDIAKVLYVMFQNQFVYNNSF